MELELETGDAPIPRPRPVKWLSDVELAELRMQLIGLLDSSWIQHSPAVQSVRTQAAHQLRLSLPKRHHAPGHRTAPA